MISIIVPIYKAERYLRESLDSIVGQNYADWELILVDDASPDNSLEICRSYEKQYGDRIKIAIHSHNKGLSASRNTGITMATGDYILFLDADDSYLPLALNTMASYLDRYSEVDMVCGKIINATEKPAYILDNPLSLQVYSPEEALKKTFYQDKDLLHSAWGKLYRRKLFEGIKLFKEGSWFEDMEIFPRLVLNCHNIAVINQAVYFYRINPTSFVNTWSKGRLDALTITEQIVSEMKSRHKGLIKSAESLMFSANFNGFFLASFHGETQTANECWSKIKAGRLQALTDSRVRIKNKIGALLSYLGKNVMLSIAKKNPKYGG